MRKNQSEELPKRRWRSILGGSRGQGLSAANSATYKGSVIEL